MPTYFRIINAPNQIMVTNSLYASAGRRLIPHSRTLKLQSENSGGLVNLFSRGNHSIEGLGALIQFSHNERVDDRPCDVGVSVRLEAGLILEDISAVEILADVFPDVELKQERAARVLPLEPAYVENKVIKKNELLSFHNSQIEIFSSDYKT